MYKLAELKNKHAGRMAVILGGGPSLPEDLRGIPSEALLIMVNDHAAHIGVEADYMVMMDNPSIKPELMRLVQEFKGIKVNELLQYSDVDMRGVVRPDARSGIFATWLAMYLGCIPILLCGMDLYQGEKKYCHDKDDFMGEKAIYAEPLEQHLKQWRTLLKYKGSKRIKARSGPLVEIFGRYYQEDML